MANRILETIKGRDEAIKAIRSWAASFNEINGADRMFISPSGLCAADDEGSGEFYKAVCLNINEAESCATEIYQIETCW
jgi:hypothetical protein